MGRTGYLLLYLGFLWLRQGLLFIAMRATLCCGKQASLVAEHGLWALGHLWHMGLVAQGMWDLPRPGVEPISPALQGGFLTTGPPGVQKRAMLLLLLIKTGKHFGLKEQEVTVSSWTKESTLSVSTITLRKVTAKGKLYKSHLTSGKWIMNQMSFILALLCRRRQEILKLFSSFTV